jgi:hypothetical protein
MEGATMMYAIHQHIPRLSAPFASLESTPAWLARIVVLPFVCACLHLRFRNNDTHMETSHADPQGCNKEFQMTQDLFLFLCSPPSAETCRNPLIIPFRDIPQSPNINVQTESELPRFTT